MATDYRGIATKEYDTGYNQKVQALKNQLANTLAGYETQKTGINQQYDTSVNNQNINTKNSQNRFSNQMLGRGLGRSSVATTGLGEMDMINNRLIGEINQKRANAIGNVDAMKATAMSNNEAMLAQMAADRENAILALARQLEDRDYQKQLQEREMALKEKQFALQQQQYSRGYGGGSRYGRKSKYNKNIDFPAPTNEERRAVLNEYTKTLSNPKKEAEWNALNREASLKRFGGQLLKEMSQRKHNVKPQNYNPY